MGRGSFNTFGAREFSSVWGSAAIIVPLCVSLMPARSAPAQNVDLLGGSEAPRISGDSGSVEALWPRLFLVMETTKPRSNL